MNTRTGEIGPMDEMKKRFPTKDLVPIDESNLDEWHRMDLEKHGKTHIGARTRCPCGSGKRFKSCCMKL